MFESTRYKYNSNSKFIFTQNYKELKMERTIRDAKAMLISMDILKDEKRKQEAKAYIATMTNVAIWKLKSH